MTAEVAVFTGLPASGKSTFFRAHLGATHDHISKDLFPNNKNKSARQERLIRTSLENHRCVAVDNTNPAPEDRGPLIELGREYGARMVDYYLEATVEECLERNAARTGREMVPEVAIHAAAKKLIPPSPHEGFDALFRVRLTGEGLFEVRCLSGQ